MPIRTSATADAPADEPLSATGSRHAARARAWSCFAAVAMGIGLAHLGREPIAELNPLVGDAPLSPALFGLAGLAAAVGLLLPAQAGRAAVLVSAACLGAGVYQARVHERPRDDLARILGPASPGTREPMVRVEGRVLGRVEQQTREPGSLDAMLSRFSQASGNIHLRLDTVHVRDRTVSTTGVVGVSAPGLVPGDVQPGQRVRVTGLYHPPGRAMNPGLADPAAWAAQSGRSGWIRTNTGAIEPLDSRGTGDRLCALPPRTLAALRSSATDLLGAPRHTPGDAVLGAMLLGERSPSGREEARFARTGTVHLLSISGFHLAVLVGLVVGVVRLTGDRPRAECVAGLAAIALYVAVVPARTPIVRAAMLATAMLLAHAFSRRWDRLATLGWVALLIALARPLDLFSLGFQLTVGVTALLLWLNEARHQWVFGGPRLIGVPDDPTLARALWRWTRALVVTSVLVWLAAAPVILFHTGAVNPLSPVAVIVTTPIATLVQIVGMASLLLHAVTAPAAVLGIGLARGLSSVLAAVAGAFDDLPGYAVLPEVSAAWAAVAVCAAIFMIRRARLRDPWPWLGLVAVSVWLGIETRVNGRLPDRVAARVDMLSVGDGTCLLVRAGDDALLWDCGSLRPALGVRRIPFALRALGRPSVPVAVITHANIDHYAALPDAAPAVGLRTVYVSAPALETMLGRAPGSPEAVFLGRLADLGVAVHPLSRGDAVPLGDQQLDILWPPADPPSAIRARNDRSLVARLAVPTDAGKRAVLLTGDIQRGAMIMLLADAGDHPIDADILELPHHGSHHAAAERFFGAVSPFAVLQSTGPSRAGDARWDEERAWVAGEGGSWGVTAVHGAVFAEITTDGEVRTGSVIDPIE